MWLQGTATLPRLNPFFRIRTGMRPPSIRERLASLDLELPPPPAPKGAYLPVVIEGNLAIVSGMLPLEDGRLVAEGLVDGEVDLSTATRAARWCALNGLSALEQALGSLDRIRRILRVGVFVASSPTFVRQPEVANGASDLLLSVFGGDGPHARTSVSTGRLPLNSPVEVEMWVSLRPPPSSPPE